MGRKRKFIEIDKDNDTQIIARKCTLNSLLNRNLSDELREYIIDYFTGMCEKATIITNLASLLFLYRVNSETDNGADSTYFNNNGDDEIKKCFQAVMKGPIKDFPIPIEYRQMVQQAIGADFEWPDSSDMGNVFNYLYELYTTNTVNNYMTHRWKRIRWFLQIQAYEWNVSEIDGIAEPNDRLLINDADITALLKHLFYQRPLCPGNDCKELVYEDFLLRLREIGGPEDNNMRDFYWFRSLPFFCRIQRAVEKFHTENVHLITEWKEYGQDKMMPQPSPLRPPNIRNFTVVPMNSFQLKHIPIDTKLLLSLTNRLIPKDEKKVGQNDFFRHRDQNWAYYFDMEKINKLVRGKHPFRQRILTDSVSASIMFNKPKREQTELSPEEILGTSFFYEIGMDPGMKTYNASVRRTISTGKEENIKISSKRYHWQAKQPIRKRKAKRLTADYTKIEQDDLKAHPVMPSPRGSQWKSYIRHRLRMLQRGMAAYATRKYARLRMDKYIESNRAIDHMVIRLTNRKPTIFFMGAVEISPDSPFRIKKHVRCPGNRKLVKAIKKRNDCVVRFVAEPYTSQTCARCLKRFPRNTRSHRFKVCHNCVPTPEVGLPPIIVTQLSRRQLKLKRQEMRDERDANEVAGNAAQNPNQQLNNRLVSKVKVYRKNWRPIIEPNVETENAAAQDEDEIVYVEDLTHLTAEEANAYLQQTEPSNQRQTGLKTFWHRDIVAAKCILYKGRFELENGYTPDIFTLDRGLQIHFDGFNTYLVEAQ